jgi:hypothetical protein
MFVLFVTFPPDLLVYGGIIMFRVGDKDESTTIAQYLLSTVC